LCASVGIIKKKSALTIRILDGQNVELQKHVDREQQGIYRNEWRAIAREQGKKTFEERVTSEM